MSIFSRRGADKGSGLRARKLVPKYLGLYGGGEAWEGEQAPEGRVWGEGLEPIGAKRKISHRTSRTYRTHLILASQGRATTAARKPRHARLFGRSHGTKTTGGGERALRGQHVREETFPMEQRTAAARKTRGGTHGQRALGALRGAPLSIQDGWSAGYLEAWRGPESSTTDDANDGRVGIRLLGSTEERLARRTPGDGGGQGVAVAPRHCHRNGRRAARGTPPALCTTKTRQPGKVGRPLWSCRGSVR